MTAAETPNGLQRRCFRQEEEDPCVLEPDACDVTREEEPDARREIPGTQRDNAEKRPLGVSNGHIIVDLSTIEPKDF